MRDVLGVCADATEDAEDGLHQHRRLDQFAVQKMCKIIEVADVVAFELELRAMALAKVFKNALDVPECISKYQIIGAFEIGFLPIVFEFLVAIEHRVEAEIHRPHVERAHLRRGLERRGQPLFDGHLMAAAGGDVDHRLGRLLDAR